MPKKGGGLRQFADLSGEGLGKQEQSGVFWGDRGCGGVGQWYPNAHYVLKTCKQCYETFTIHKGFDSSLVFIIESYLLNEVF